MNAPAPADFATNRAGRKALAILDANRGRFVRITFTKRGDGSERSMTAIFSRRYLLGAWRFNPAARGLLPVWDVAAGQIKLIPLDGITILRAGGERRRIAVGPFGPARVAPRPVAPRVERVAVEAPRRSAAETQAALALLF